MAATANVQISGSVIGTPGGSIQIGPITVTNATGCWQVQDITLVNGANTITVPLAPVPVGCIIVLPTANADVVTLKGVAGDTGTAIGTNGPQILYWGASTPPVSFVLSSAGLQTSPTMILFF